MYIRTCMYPVNWHSHQNLPFPIGTTWSGAHRWPYVFLDFGYFVQRFTMFLCFFSPTYLRGLFSCHWNSLKTSSTGGVESLLDSFLATHGCATSIEKKAMQCVDTELRSTLNTGYITGLDMYKPRTEAVHCVALWTRVTSPVWTCVRYVPKQSIA